MFSERLSRFIASIGETPTSFETKIGVSKGAIYKPVKNSKTVGVEILEKIVSKYPRLNLDWLITGSGTMLKEENGHSTGEEMMVIGEGTVEYHHYKGPKASVRLVNEMKAVGWNGDPDGGKGVTDFVFYLPAPLLPVGPAYAAFITTDNSMEPSILQGSYAIADLIAPHNYKRIPATCVVITGDSVLIRKVTPHSEKAVFYLEAEHPGYPAVEVPEREIASIWGVKALFTSGFSSGKNNLFSLYQDLESRIKLLEKKLVGKSNPGVTGQ